MVLVADPERDLSELFLSNGRHDAHCAVLVRPLRDAARQQPQAPATHWLEPAQCTVPLAWATRQTLPVAAPPTIAQAVCWIARLGGYLARKNDPTPGAEALRRGLRLLHDVTLT